ncbi:MAG: DUF983 domain-containing protein [Alphaproteobacteria bacterium]|nr:DUF983 domain-containing protein [Alphaproteobacteria bacterium]
MSQKISPLSAGIHWRCPECGEGPVFKTYLGLAPYCTSCGADFSKADSGDGPAFFVMFLVGILVTPPVLLVQALFDPPAWVQVVVWTPIIILVAVLLLRPFKSVLFALQWKHKAEEATWTSKEGDQE